MILTYVSLVTTQAVTGGRLFTFLPLPLKTGFPAHVHALFALTQSRQNLHNSGETGNRITGCRTVTLSPRSASSLLTVCYM